MLRYKLEVKIKGGGRGARDPRISRVRSWQVPGREHEEAFETAMIWWKDELGDSWSVDRIEVIVDWRTCRSRDRYCTDLAMRTMRVDWEDLLSDVLVDLVKDSHEGITTSLTIH